MCLRTWGAELLMLLISQLKFRKPLHACLINRYTGRTIDKLQTTYIAQAFEERGLFWKNLWYH